MVSLAASAARANAEVAELRATLARERDEVGTRIAQEVAEHDAERDAIIRSLGGEVPVAVDPQPSVGGKSRFIVHGADAAAVGAALSRPALLKREADPSALPVERTKIRSVDDGGRLVGGPSRHGPPAKQFVRNWAKKAKKKTGGSGSGGEGWVACRRRPRRASLMIRKLVERRGSAAAAAPAAAEATQRV